MLAEPRAPPTKYPMRTFPVRRSRPVAIPPSARSPPVTAPEDGSRLRLPNACAQCWGPSPGEISSEAVESVMNCRRDQLTLVNQDLALHNKTCRVEDCHLIAENCIRCTVGDQNFRSAVEGVCDGVRWVARKGRARLGVGPRIGWLRCWWFRSWSFRWYQRSLM